MPPDYLSILGLSPGRHEPAEIARRFVHRRKRLLADLRDPAKRAAARQRLDELYLAHAALREPRIWEERSRRRSDEDDRQEQLRPLIAASLEGGLLRYSRRREILAEARRLGISDFHAQLMIAQTQFGDEQLLPGGSRPASRATDREAGLGARVAAVGVLALALFLGILRWLG